MTCQSIEREHWQYRRGDTDIGRWKKSATEDQKLNLKGEHQGLYGDSSIIYFKLCAHTLHAKHAKVPGVSCWTKRWSAPHLCGWSFAQPPIVSVVSSPQPIRHFSLAAPETNHERATMWEDCHTEMSRLSWRSSTIPVQYWMLSWSCIPQHSLS